MSAYAIQTALGHLCIVASCAVFIAMILATPKWSKKDYPIHTHIHKKGHEHETQ